MQKHKIIALVVALPVALILWIYVITTVTPEMSRTINSIPVSFDGVIALEERGLMITSGANARVNLELEGNRVSVSKLSADKIRVVVDCSRITEPGEYKLNYVVSYPELTTNSQINVLRRSPATVSITVSQIVTKQVPVEFEWVGTVQEGYLFDAQSVTMDYEEIAVTGPDFAVEQIERALVEYDVSPLTETMVEKCRYRLEAQDGTEVSLSEQMSVNVDEITVTMPVQRYKDLELKVELLPGGGASELHATVKLTPDSIRVTGGSSAINELEDVLVIGSIDLAQVLNSSKQEFRLVLPAGVTNFSGIETIQAEVHIVGLNRVSYTVSKITLLNVPEGRKAELTTKSITVALRGTVSDMNKLKEEDITVTVDLSDYTQTGAFTVPATVTITGLPNIGVIGDTEVGVSLS